MRSGRENGCIASHAWMGSAGIELGQPHPVDLQHAGTHARRVAQDIGVGESQDDPAGCGECAVASEVRLPVLRRRVVARPVQLDGQLRLGPGAVQFHDAVGQLDAVLPYAPG